MLEELGALVLGGDVYDYTGSKPTMTYDNWYIEPGSTETTDEFCKRSCKRSLKFITDYDQKLGSGRLYTLVVTGDPIDTLRSTPEY